MKYFASLLTAATAASAFSAAVVQDPSQHQDVLAPSEAEQYLLEIEPGSTKWATEDEKWELRRVPSPIPSSRSHTNLHPTERRQLHGHHGTAASLGPCNENTIDHQIPIPPLP